MRFLVALACVSLLAAQNPPQDPRFDARSRLVLVPVSITQANGHPLDGLEAHDFVVMDNQHRRPVTVDTIATGVAPIALVIAVQSSGISLPVLEKVRKIGAMIQPLITGERGCAAVVSFASGVDWVQELTNSPGAIQNALRGLTAEGHDRAAMLDAVSQAVDRLRRQPNARRVLLLISESRDRGSRIQLQAAVTAAQSADVTVYAATYSTITTPFTSKASLSAPPRAPDPQATPQGEVFGTGNGAPASKYNPKETAQIDLMAVLGELAHLTGPDAAHALSQATGGTTFPFTRQKGLDNAIARLGAELHSQYVLSFVPEDAAPGYHELQVSLARTRSVHIRARPGYWAPDPR